MTGEPSFFSIGVGDVGRARAFYGELLGWELADYRQGATVATAGIPGGIHGNDPGASPYLFFAVADLEAAVAKVRELGGSVDHEDDEADDNGEVTARFGRFRLCTDDQGSRFGLHQPPG